MQMTADKKADIIHLRAARYADDCAKEREQIGKVKLTDCEAKRVWLAHYEGYRDGMMARKKGYK